MSQRQRKFQFKCHAKPSLMLALVVGCSLFLSLSYWQLQRGLDKQLKDQIQNQSFESDTALTLAESLQLWKKNPIAINDRNMQVTGTFEKHLFILHDNRIQHGLAGYNVYGVLKLAHAFEDKTHLLVNLGWSVVPNYDRTLFPKINVLPVQANVTLKLEAINPNVFVVQSTPPEMFQQEKTSYFRVQSIQFEQLTQTLDYELIPFVARATEIQTSPALQLALTPIAERGISAEKHFGYSAQWLFFCLIAIGIFLYTQCSWYYIIGRT